jgi:predicted nucleotide-binding protein (sugar kinase/HSP70/actin superfamily)
MGDITLQLITAGISSEGFDAKAANIPTMEELRYGRAHSSCKECLPLQLTVGTLIKYAKNKNPDDVIVYFMPENREGPCRFGQYSSFMKNLIRKEKIVDTAVISPYADEGYAGLPMYRAIVGTIAGDVLDDIKNALKVLAVDKKQALKIFDEEFEELKGAFADKKKKPLVQLKSMVKNLNTIPLKYPLSKAKVISLIGEIYVRRDSFSRQNLEDKLAEKGFIVKVAPVLEWFHYLVYVFRHNIHNMKYSLAKKAMLQTKAYGLYLLEKKVKNVFKDSELYDFELVDVEDVINHSKHLMSPKLGGEAILTIGSGLKEVLSHACGVISVGPFGCMPSRLAEAILSEEMNAAGKEAASGKKVRIHGLSHLPFLAIETDGNAFPPIIESKIEAFCLQANRVHKKMIEHKTV